MHVRFDPATEKVGPAEKYTTVLLYSAALFLRFRTNLRRPGEAPRGRDNSEKQSKVMKTGWVASSADLHVKMVYRRSKTAIRSKGSDTLLRKSFIHVRRDSKTELIINNLLDRAGRQHHPISVAWNPGIARRLEEFAQKGVNNHRRNFEQEVVQRFL